MPKKKQFSIELRGGVVTVCGMIRRPSALALRVYGGKPLVTAAVTPHNEVARRRRRRLYYGANYYCAPFELLARHLNPRLLSQHASRRLVDDVMDGVVRQGDFIRPLVC